MEHDSYRTHPRFDLAAELVALDATSPASYSIASDEIDLSILSPAEQNAALNNLIDLLALTRPTELPREPELWNNLRTFLKYFESLEDTARSKVADGITSSFSQLIDALKRDIKALARAEQLRQNAQEEDSDDEAVSAEDLRSTYCECIEMWSFLVNWLIYIADKVANSASAGSTTAGASGSGKGRGRGKKNTSTNASASTKSSGAAFPWTASLLPNLLYAINQCFDSVPSVLLYPLATPRDALLSTLLRPALHLFERESNLKTLAGQKDIKSMVFDITCNAVKRHGQAQTAQTMLLQMLQYYEHLPEVIAQLLTVLRVDYDSPRLGEEILVEISGREFGSSGNAGGAFAMTASMENKTPRVFARFLVTFAESNARTTLKNIAQLKNLIDSEAYPIRNAMVEIFYILIRELVMSQDAQIQSASNGEGNSPGEGEMEARETSEEAKAKQIEGFWKVLLERLLDVNSYVRVKVLAVFAKLCDLPAKFPAQRTKLLSLAQRALKDKSSSARKACITLLIRLILTHPYGLMHGGELEQRVWEARVEETKRLMQQLGGGIVLPQDDDAEAADDEEEEEDVSQDDGGDETIDPDATAEEASTKAAKPRKSSGRPSINTTELVSQLSPQDFETLNRLKLTHRYYSDALSFIKALASSMPTLEDLLFSSNKGEALESMDFFRVAAEYKLPGAEKGMRRMVHLIWTKDNAMVEPAAGGVTGAANVADGAEGGTAGAPTATRSIRGRLIEVYMSLYFSPLQHLSETENAGLIARNLVQRTQGATLAELTSLEELLSTIANEGHLPSSVIDRLWAVYSSRSSGKRSAERSQRRGAIVVLSMLAVAKKQIVEDKIDVLLGVGLGPLGIQDPILAKWTVLALSRVGGSAKKVKGALSSKRTRFPMHHPMFAKLRTAILASSLVSMADDDEATSKVNAEEKKAQWFSLAEVCISTIYDLGEQPDRLCADIIRWFMTQVFGSKHGSSDTSRDRQSSVASATSFGTAAEGSPANSQDEFSTQPATGRSGAGVSHPALGNQASAFQLSQLLFIVGHVALKQIVYLESVEREYKRRKAEAESSAKAAAEQDKVATPKGRGKRAGGRVSSPTEVEDGEAANAEKGAAGTKKDGEEEGDELEQVAGNVEDEIGEIIADVREKELLFGGRSLLALFGPMVVHVASNPKSYQSDHLRKSAVLTLCKFMCVSSSFCEGNLSLLLHILSTSSDATTRSNVVIALGDIAVSFGTLVDENSDRLYAGLHDRDLGVKKHTLMVLTHLILNGMIKVKGQLGEMAKCIEDPETRVSDLAKLFFSELSTKENAVYNNLPDIISHLSIGKHAIEDEESYQRTMRFIFTFVDKEKQAENVVEKLVQRFRLTNKVRQWRDVAFCLSLLPYKSERSVKKLIDGLPFYQDKLHDEQVYKRLIEIVAKARAAKTGGSGAATVGGGEAELQDFEQLLENFHSKGVEEGELEKGTQNKVAKAQAQARLQQASSQAGRGRLGGRGRGRGRGSATRSSGRNRNSATPESDEEDVEGDDSEEAEQTKSSPAKRQKRNVRSSQAAAAASESESDLESDDSAVAPPSSRGTLPSRGGRRGAAKASVPQETQSSTRSRPTRGASRRKVVESSDEDDDDDDD
ncbi:unnamed protein product [Sympodiomycopsis kandeliae]